MRILGRAAKNVRDWRRHFAIIGRNFPAAAAGMHGEKITRTYEFQRTRILALLRRSDDVTDQVFADQDA